ncbi:hypothetical protein PR202_ga27364 [Eleusine coracana subsp. coracana]|uniref:AMP-activated protein kinase glycogen-binding domain-containing protein n=1 Tax=Eleusine coracana subsp. coracana TaxID=191504 RepID=A0AAV5DFQ4_ELECO|nr:hypothetical protein PR202_ga27364 [Eleusine coracana subsp. coracana]
MNCLQNLLKEPPIVVGSRSMRRPAPLNLAPGASTSGAESSAVEVEKSDVYSTNMTQAMGAVGLYVLDSWSKRASFPKLEAIKLATADILTGLSRNCITLKWDNGSCSSVEISGLDVGWGQRIPLTYNEEKGAWLLETELPEGRYEYKYIVDGKWLCNENEQITKPNADGHVNNFIQVSRDGTSDEERELRERVTGPDPDLTDEERLMVREYLEQYVEG